MEAITPRNHRRSGRAWRKRYVKLDVPDLAMEIGENWRNFGEINK